MYCSNLAQDIETGAGEFGKELPRSSVQVEDGRIAKVVEQKIPHEPSDYIDEHIFDVICLAEGKTEVAFLVGNSQSGANQ